MTTQDRWVEVFGPFDCGEYFCEDCGCCMGCNGECPPCVDAYGGCRAIDYVDPR